MDDGQRLKVNGLWAKNKRLRVTAGLRPALTRRGSQGVGGYTDIDYYIEHVRLSLFFAVLRR